MFVSVTLFTLFVGKILININIFADNSIVEKFFLEKGHVINYLTIYGKKKN